MALHFNHETLECLIVRPYCQVSILVPFTRPICTETNWKVVKCITFLELAAVAFGMSLSNFGLVRDLVMRYTVTVCVMEKVREDGNLGDCQPKVCTIWLAV